MDDPGESRGAEGRRLPILGVDHVLIGVRDLGAAKETYRQLGFTLGPRGRHVGRETAAHTIMFARDYIALIGVVGEARAADDLRQFVAARDGLYKLAFATDDADALSAALAAVGAPAEPSTDLGRTMEGDGSAAGGGGESDVRFKLVHLPPSHTPGLDAQVFHHLTPRTLRKPEWLSHPNGASMIAEVTVLMDTLDGVAGAYRRLFGVAAATGEERRGCVLVRTGRSVIKFVTPRSFTVEHYDIVPDPDLPLPRLAALTLVVKDPRATALYLAGQRVPFGQEPDDTVLVHPAHACGVLLEFARARE